MFFIIFVFIFVQSLERNQLDMALLLTSLPNDCLTSIAELIPARYWPQLRSTCRDLRAAVRDATTGLVIDLRSLPFLTPATAASSVLPTDQLLLTRVREVRILLHKDRDESDLTTKGLGEATACPVAPLLREIDRARGSAAESAAYTNAAAARPPPPLRVSLCLRAPRGFIDLFDVSTWLDESGIAAQINGIVDVRADGVVCEALKGTRLASLRPSSSSSCSSSSSSSSSSAWGGIGSPPGCRFRVEMKFTVIEPYCEGALLLTSLIGAPVASLSVLSFPRASSGESAAGREFGRCVRMFAKTLEELRLAESVPAWAVCSALTGDGEGARCRWPALRKLVLLGSPVDGSDHGDGDGDPGPFRPPRAAAAADGGERGPLVPFPSLETLAVKRKHAGAWLRRFGDAIDPAGVALERL